MGYACDSCSRTLCVDCIPLRECTYLECSKEMCAECAEKGGEDVVHRCIGGCGDMICNRHRLFEFQQGISECEECLRFLHESFKCNARLLEKVKYRKRHAGLEANEGNCPCGWCSSRPKLRFKVGQLVSCRMSVAHADRVYGKVIRLWHQESSWVENYEWAPYLVELNGGRRIFAPLDIDVVIRAQTKKRGRTNTF